MYFEHASALLISISNHNTGVRIDLDDVVVIVVKEPVAVIVNAVARNLARVGPDVVDEIGVIVVNAGIDNSNDQLVNGDEGSAVIAARCLVNVTIGNIKKIQMPLSGESGLVLIIALGLGVTAISAAGIIFKGKKKESKK